jgi:hypothetical protein
MINSPTRPLFMVAIRASLHQRAALHVGAVGTANENARLDELSRDDVGRNWIHPKHPAELWTRQRETRHLVIVVVYEPH